MEHFVAPLTRAQSDAFADLIDAHIDTYGWGLWAVESADGLIGFTGLASVGDRMPFAPATEIGWRLARPAWGQGYATEAASAALDFAFAELRLDEVVALTAVANVRSQAVMRRLGMSRDPADDFDNPVVPAGHHLRRHVLFRRPREG